MPNQRELIYGLSLISETIISKTSLILVILERKRREVEAILWEEDPWKVLCADLRGAVLAQCLAGAEGQQVPPKSTGVPLTAARDRPGQVQVALEF